MKSTKNFVYRVLVLLTLSTSITRHEFLFAQSPNPGSLDIAQEIKPATLDSGNSPVRPSSASDTNFIVDEGGDLDRYLFRQNTPNGKLSFTLPIGRYFSKLITPSNINASGFLKPNIANQLKSRHILPARARLTLEVYDVDHDNNVINCHEVDHVYVNGFQLQNATSTGPAILTSGNNTWSTWSVEFPIEFIKFPHSSGQNGNRPTPVDQVIEIDINTLQCLHQGQQAWAVEVDWAQIYIDAPIRPIVFVHGYTGDKDTFSKFQEFAMQDGIPYLERATYGDEGIDKIADVSTEVRRDIEKTVTEYGVDKVNLFAHSKGGLVGRVAAYDSATAGRLQSLITFGSPHHGISSVAVFVARNGICRKYLNDELRLSKCKSGADELHEDVIRESMNYSGCRLVGDWWSLHKQWQGCSPIYVRQPNISYKTFVGELDEVMIGQTWRATYPWSSNTAPYPIVRIVDAHWSTFDHILIKQTAAAYRCALNKIDSRAYSSVNCESPIRVLAQTQLLSEVVEPSTLAQGSITLNAATTADIPIYADAVTQLSFLAYSIDDMSVALVTPSGATVTPSTASSFGIVFTKTQGFLDSSVGWQHHYTVSSPQVGLWKLRATSAQATAAMMSVTANSDLRLRFQLDKASYATTDTLKLEAGLINASGLVSADAMTATIVQPNGSISNLVLHDDGLVGDIAAGDNRFFSNFILPNLEGRYTLTIFATKGNNTRIQQTSFMAGSSSGKIVDGITSSLYDSNFNSRYDWLYIDIPVVNNSSISRAFAVFGELTDNAGNHIASARSTSTSIASGAIAFIRLSFDGREIRQSRKIGPYYLARYTLLDETNLGFPLQEIVDPYETVGYSSSQFEGASISVASGVAHGIDADSNGKYESITILIKLDLDQAGEYQWNGRLVDSRGSEVGWAVGSGYLSNGSNANFTFYAESFAKSKLNGPYTLRDVSISQLNGGSNVALSEVFTTHNIFFTQFEGAKAEVYLPLIRR